MVTLHATTTPNTQSSINIREQQRHHQKQKQTKRGMTTESSDNKCTCENGAIRHPKGRVGHHELLRSNNALARGNGWYPEGEEKGTKRHSDKTVLTK